MRQTKLEKERRAAHLKLCWDVVKHALEWNRCKKGALATAMKAVALRRMCDRLDRFETGKAHVWEIP